jgi:hypothetical protein
MSTQNKTHLDLNTSIGFYTAYFELLPQFNTKKEAFNYLNNEIEYITGKPKYINFAQFLNCKV